MAGAPAASAHTALLFIAPAAGSTVPVSPRALTLTFDEPVTLEGPPVTLASATHRALAVGPAVRGRGRSVVTVPLAGRLGDGVYTVSWQVISSDGDPVSGEYRFAVGVAPDSLASATGYRAEPGEWPTAALRWLLFAGLAVALGGLAGQVLATRYDSDAPAPRSAPWVWQGSLVGAAASAGLGAVILGGGDLAAGITHPSLSRLLAAGPGRIAAAELAAFAAAVVLARLRSAWAMAPLLAVVAAEGVRAHPESLVPVGGALLTWAHLLSAALWNGMLLYVVRVALAWRADSRAVRRLFGRYARAAIWLFAAVVATGIVSALVLVPLSSLLATVYGRVLLAKAVLVGAAAGLALAGRRWLRHGLVARPGPVLATRAEAGTLAGVLAVTGLLTALPAPAAPVQQLPFPPPASGPVVPLGGRAGEVGIYGTASTGQVVLQLSTPEANGGAGTGQIPATLTLASPHKQPVTLTVRDCGPGCIVAPAPWRHGDNLLTVHAAPGRWAGGTVSLHVPWPPVPGGQLPHPAVSVMRAVPAMTVYERVTSDTRAWPRYALPDRAQRPAVPRHRAVQGRDSTAGGPGAQYLGSGAAARLSRRRYLGPAHSRPLRPGHRRDAGRPGSPDHPRVRLPRPGRRPVTGGPCS